MPVRRKPVSASISLFNSFHSRSASIDSGTSRASRPILRHQPQLRLDCSAAISPFSHTTTGIPSRARKKAVHTPMMPPPTMTTTVRAGISGSDGTKSTDGGIAKLFQQFHYLLGRPADFDPLAGDHDGPLHQNGMCQNGIDQLVIRLRRIAERKFIEWRAAAAQQLARRHAHFGE